MTIDNELIDNLLKDYKKPEDIIGENGLLKQLTKQLLERAMATFEPVHAGDKDVFYAASNFTPRKSELLMRLMNRAKRGHVLLKLTRSDHLYKGLSPLITTHL